MNLLGFHNLFKVPKDALKCELLYFIILVSNLKMHVMSNVLENLSQGFGVIKKDQTYGLPSSFSPSTN